MGNLRKNFVISHLVRKSFLISHKVLFCATVMVFILRRNIELLLFFDPVCVVNNCNRSYRSELCVHL